MKKLTKIALIGAAVLVISATSVTALAASGAGAGGMMAGTGNRAFVSSQTAVTDPAKIDALRAQCLDRMKAALDAKVAAGTMTQAQEDTLLAAMKERLAACDGTGAGCNATGGAACAAGSGCGMTGRTGFAAGSGCGMMRGR